MRIRPVIRALPGSRSRPIRRRKSASAIEMVRAGAAARPGRAPAPCPSTLTSQRLTVASPLSSYWISPVNPPAFSGRNRPAMPLKMSRSPRSEPSVRSRRRSSARRTSAVNAASPRRRTSPASAARRAAPSPLPSAPALRPAAPAPSAPAPARAGGGPAAAGERRLDRGRQPPLLGVLALVGLGRELGQDLAPEKLERLHDVLVAVAAGLGDEDDLVDARVAVAADEVADLVGRAD